MNGVLVDASTFYPDGGYSGDPGSLTNPWCLSDYDDLYACTSDQCSYILTNDIDLSRYNAGDPSVNIHLQEQGYIDFNGYCFYNLTVRTSNIICAFINLYINHRSNPSTYYIKKPYFKNFIFYNSSLFRFINICNVNQFSYDTINITDGRFEVYLNLTDKNTSSYSNYNTSHIFYTEKNIKNAQVCIFKNCFTKLSGIYILNSNGISSSVIVPAGCCILRNNYGISPVSTSVGDKLIDCTFHYNDFIITNVSGGNTYAKYDIFPTHFRECDTVEITGKIILKPNSFRRDPEFGFFRCTSGLSVNNYSCLNNVFINCEITTSSSGYTILNEYSSSANRIIVNIDKIAETARSADCVNNSALLLCTEEQLKDTEYLLENGMMVLRAE